MYELKNKPEVRPEKTKNQIEKLKLNLEKNQASQIKQPLE